MIYLLDESGRHVGPFENREAVDRFIKMMALCGEDWADSKVLEEGGEDALHRHPAQVDPCAGRFKDTSRMKLVGRRPLKSQIRS